MTEEYRSVLKLDISGFKTAASEARKAVDDVKKALDSTRQTDTFTGATDSAREAASAMNEAREAMDSTRQTEPFTGVTDSAREATSAVDEVRDALDETQKVKPFTGTTGGAKEAASAVKKTGEEVRKANQSIRDAGRAAYNSNGGFSALRKGMNDTTMAAKSLLAELSKFISLAAIVAGIKAAISAGASAAAEEAQFAQVFGVYEGQARRVLKSIADESGSTADAMRADFSSIASFARVSGMDTGNALSLAERGLRAAADSAAFYDRELSEVTENLRSFLKGNYENDAALGLSSTEFTRNTMAMQLYGQKFQELTEEQKQWTLLAQIEQANRLSGALGQAARESGNWTTQIQKLKAQLKTLLSVVGRGFIAALTPIVNFVNIALSALVDFANGVSKVFSMVFGSAQTALSATAGSVGTGGLSDALENVQDAASGAADGVGNVGRAAKGASSAARELARSVMGFDKINKLTDSSSSGGSGGGGGGGSGGGGGTGAGVAGGLAEAAGQSVLGDVISQTEKLSAAMQALKNWLAGLNFEPLKESWEKLTGAAEKLGGVLKGALAWGVEHVLAPLGKWTIEEAAPRVVTLLANATELLADACIVLKPAWEWAREHVFSPLASFAADTFTASIDALNAVLEDLDGLLKDIQAVMSGEKSIGDLFQEWFTIPNITDAITDISNYSEKINGLIQLVTNPAGTATGIAMDKLTELTGLDKFLEKLDISDTITHMLAQVVESWTGFFGFLGEQWDGVKEKAGGIWDSITEKASGVKDKITGFWDELKQVDIKLALTEGPKDLWQSFKKQWEDNPAVKTAVALVQDSWKTVSEWVKDKLGGKVEKAISLAKDGWKSIAEWVKDKLGGGVNKAIGLAKDGWSSVASWVKDHIGGSVNKAIGLTRDGWSSVSSWAKDKLGGGISLAVKLFKGWKGSVAKALGLTKLWSRFTIKLPKVSVSWYGSPVKLPHFSLKWNAKGGILDGAQIFGMAGNTLLGGGEAGREAVLPLESNTGWMDKIADRVAQRVGESGRGGNQPIVVKVMLDGKQVAESTIREWQRQARSGRYPLSELV